MPGSWSTGCYVGGIKIILARDADEREQGVPASVGQGSAHALGTGHLCNGTDRPIRGDPFARGVGEHRRQVENAGRLVDGGGLHRRDLMLTERFSHDVEAARQRCIAKGAFSCPRPCSSNRSGERLFRVDELGLGLGQS